MASKWKMIVNIIVLVIRSGRALVMVAILFNMIRQRQLQCTKNDVACCCAACRGRPSNYIFSIMRNAAAISHLNVKRVYVQRFAMTVHGSKDVVHRGTVAVAARKNCVIEATVRDWETDEDERGRPRDKRTLACSLESWGACTANDSGWMHGRQIVLCEIKDQVWEMNEMRESKRKSAWAFAMVLCVCVSSPLQYAMVHCCCCCWWIRSRCGSSLCNYS